MSASPGFAANPGKVITVTHHDGTVIVSANGRQIAASNRALVLSEAPYPAAYYIPFDDIDFTALEKSATASTCPYKGAASYWRINGGGDVMWAYETPYDEMAAISGHGAFYANRVDVSII